MAIEFELNSLRSALALEEHRNFARAAHARRISQPSLSRNIQQIEQRVGTKLFLRSNGGVIPTPAGRIFLDQAREVIARSLDLSREMDLLKGLDKGDLCVGAGTYPSVTVVDQAILRLVHKHPKIRLQIQVDNRENLVSLLKKGELDVAVIILDELGEEESLHITRLGRHQGYFVVRCEHPLLKSGEAPSLASVLKFPVVMTSRPSTAMLKRLLAGAFAGDDHGSRTAKSFPDIACESVALMKAIVASTDAVALLPLTPVVTDVKSRKLAVVPLVLEGLQADFGVVRLVNRSPSRAAEIFVNMLQEEDKKSLELERKFAATLFASPTRTASRGRVASRPR
jgi:DNA-binding transcriptional LysR family regulator